jgi:putative transposase
LLTNDEWRQKLSRCIDAAGEETRISLVAFVYMPEHVHLLSYPLDPQPNLGLYLARIKQPFSKQIREILVARRSRLLQQLTVRERPGKTCFRFWQEGPGHDRNLFTPDAIRASIDYMHNNPVERDLCRRAIDWMWSSARYYLGEPPGSNFRSCRSSTACRQEHSIERPRKGVPRRSHWQSQWHTLCTGGDRWERR